MKYIYHKIDNKPSNYPIFSKNKKPLHALLLSLVVILFMIPNTNASKNKMEKISQINYQDQFEQVFSKYKPNKFIQVSKRLRKNVFNAESKSKGI